MDLVIELRLCVPDKWFPDSNSSLEDDLKETRDAVIRHEFKSWKYEEVLFNQAATLGLESHFGEWCPNKNVFCQERGGCDNCYLSEGLLEAFSGRV